MDSDRAAQEAADALLRAAKDGTLEKALLKAEPHGPGSKCLRISPAKNRETTFDIIAWRFFRKIPKNAVARISILR